MSLNRLADEVSRCAGVGSSEDGAWHWREGCEDCLRRTAKPPLHGRVWQTTPPAIVAFQCELYIDPRDE